MRCSWIGRRILVSIGAILLASFACGPGTSSEPTNGSSLRQALAPAAAQHLGSDNHFVFQAPSNLPADQIGQAHAVELAQALVARYAPLGGLPGIAADRGAKVDQGATRPCGRTLFARSPWLPLAPSVARTAGGGVFQRAYGSHWLVPFCESGGSMVFVVSVAAYNSALTIEDGKIVLPTTGGEWFGWRGIPQHQHSELPVGPEEAALIANQVSGSRVAGVPELLMPDADDGSPLDARWRVQLEAESEVITQTGQRRKLAQVFMGWDPQENARLILVPKVTQPLEKVIQYPTNLGSRGADEPLHYVDHAIRRDPERAIAFDVIAPISPVKP